MSGTVSSGKAIIIPVIVTASLLFSILLLPLASTDTLASGPAQATTLPQTGGTGDGTPTAAAGQVYDMPQELIVNGGFEDGFVENVGVGVGWHTFTNGDAHFGFYDDEWDMVVYEGRHAQLLEIKDADKLDRTLGIYQTVGVVPGQEYTFEMHGIVRSDADYATYEDEPPQGYEHRMLVTIDLTGGTDWEAIPFEKWTELDWIEQERTGPTYKARFDIGHYSTTFVALSDKATVFIRGWKKFPTITEANYDIDGVSIKGMPPGYVQPTPTTTGEPTTIIKPVVITATSTVTTTATPSAAPDSGGPPTGHFANPSVLVGSLVLVALLVGGAVVGMRRRQV